MKAINHTLFLLLFAPFLLSAQLTLSDSFTDGNFSQNPVWTGDTALFQVDTNQRLQLLDSLAGSAYLSTPSAIIEDAVWEFELLLDFNPSGSNFARVYLVSNQADLSGPLNGYFVRISGSSADRISLFRQTGSNISLVAESGDDWADTDPARAYIRVKRRLDGFWVLAADTGTFQNYVPLDSAFDLSHRNSAWFGVNYEYTKTRADKFFFDNLQASGRAFVDSIAPKLDSLEILSANALLLTFSENATTASMEDPANYQLSGGLGQPVLALQNPQDPRQVELNWAANFQNKQSYTLSYSGIVDDFNNQASGSVSFNYIVPEAGDVVINELMPDPVPSIGNPPNALPEREYIELYNRTNLSINLEGWTLMAGGSTEVLPAYELAADSLVVITKDEGVPEFPPGLPILGLDMSSVALTNSGTTVSLFSPGGKLISSVSYTDAWYRNPNKEDGGWSLEQIDPDNLCGGTRNWQASVNANGGTPGRRNSVWGANPDTIAPEIERIALPGEKQILVFYSEALADELLAQPLNYRINPSLKIDSLTVPLSRDRALLYLAKALAPETLYRLSLDSLPQDCSGNSMQRDTLRFGIPAAPDPGDILINELLFNPPPEGSDFVELYNASEKVFDLAKLMLGNYDPSAHNITKSELITEESFLFFPGTYLALSTDVNFLKENYSIEKPENLVEVSNLPSLPDDEGSLALSTLNLQLLEYCQYDEDMHLMVIDEAEGISLERRSLALSAQENDNWQSAAAAAGYATPGYENSQRFQPVFTAKLTPEPKVFSPNQDGYHDQVNIAFNFEQANNVVSLSVYSPSGTLIRQIAEGENVAQTGFFSWDGTDENGQLANRGIYILVLDYFNADGNSASLRETCVLSR